MANAMAKCYQDNRMDDERANLAHNVRRLREARGLSQQRISQLSRVPRPTWASLESGAANPTLSVLSRVAAGLQVSIEELIGPPRSAVQLFRAGEIRERKRGGARLRALLRRPSRRMDPIRIDGLEIDPVHRVVLSGSERLDLTRTEFDLLLALIERRGEILNRQLLLELIWGYRFDPGTNIVDVHVNRLRRKLDGALAHELIRTVRGVGYVVD